MTQWEALYFSLPFFSFLVCKSCVFIVTSDEKNIDVRKLSVWARSLWGDLQHFSLRIITDVQSMLSFALFISGILLMAALLFFVGYLVQEHHSDIIFLCDEVYETLYPIIFSLQTLTSAFRVTGAVLLSFINMFALLAKALIRIPFESTECSVAFFKALMQTMIDLSKNFSGFIRTWVISKFGDVPLQELRGVIEESRNTLLHVVNFGLCHCTPVFGKAVVLALLNPLQDNHTDHLIAHVTSVGDGLLHGSNALAEVVVPSFLSEVEPRFIATTHLCEFFFVQTSIYAFILRSDCGMTLGDFVFDQNKWSNAIEFSRQLDGIMLQCFIALHTYQRTVNLCHADLHRDNVTLKKVEHHREFTVVLQEGTKTFRLDSDIPQVHFIDFEDSMATSHLSTLSPHLSRVENAFTVFATPQTLVHGKDNRFDIFRLLTTVANNKLKESLSPPWCAGGQLVSVELENIVRAACSPIGYQRNWH
jgi:hypothetical protein